MFCPIFARRALFSLRASSTFLESSPKPNTPMLASRVTGGGISPDLKYSNSRSITWIVGFQVIRVNNLDSSISKNTHVFFIRNIVARMPAKNKPQSRPALREPRGKLSVKIAPLQSRHNSYQLFTLPDTELSFHIFLYALCILSGKTVKCRLTGNFDA